MTLTDILALYGALLATALAGWEVAKYFFERPRLRVTCYVAAIVGGGARVGNQLAYNIANTGGKPVVVTTIGGALRSGKAFLRLSELLPRTLQPGEAITIPGPMYDGEIAEVLYFTVHDALGKAWKAPTKGVMQQLAARQK